MTTKLENSQFHQACQQSLALSPWSQNPGHKETEKEQRVRGEGEKQTDFWEDQGCFCLLERGQVSDGKWFISSSSCPLPLKCLIINASGVLTLRAHSQPPTDMACCLRQGKCYI